MVSFQFQSIGLSTYLDAINKNLMCVYYDLKCQDITDSEGDIKLEVMESRRNTEFSYNLVKWCQFNCNQKDYQQIWMQSTKI